ncbi:hypothetical protein Tco_0538437 [Tanacetum coccineum]
MTNLIVYQVPKMSIDDEADEAKKEDDPSFSKPNKIDQPLLKVYKPKNSYPQHVRKGKIEERYAKFMDLIKEVRINVPFVDVLAGMPKYEKFLKDLELDALLNDYKPFLITSKKINETSLDKEFKEFMVVKIEQTLEQEEEVNDNFKELHLDEKLRIKTSIQDPPTDLEAKPLPKHLEYAFLEKESFLLIIIFALLEADE